MNEETESKILTSRRFDVECGKMNVVLFKSKQTPLLMSIDSTNTTFICHLSIADAEQLRDALIDVITDANFNEANHA